MNNNFDSAQSQSDEPRFEQEPSRNGKADPSLLDDIPISLMFVVGRLRTTLGELRSMTPGDVLELGRNPHGQVSIEAHGVMIGYGEFVEIGSRVAVELIRMDFSP
ncbi:FliM/FliN family flagellar motor switch protein [Burkholderia oklahomensis]|uniref:Surface presentation of antigens family protein n=1 Tax=Burkholderia oklahomensis TaxID=342113 RepID=A0AAI8BB67_9BURK|nr:FliM/FliN family flagellar motor switch protein [Burkholderia oklahomensis]AIO68799.1 surface presentation of antigens family protein [Burkholderia oklahomensis]AOI39585.1 RhcQ protein [Burkholderia oklahomensis EO147]KUY51516.1 RhcQ protein [Burkholderia oklahomensis EO147]QPS40062.1 FliM/FliN family flagellar motor switch protein [Burkholderia oklahomensis]